MKDFYFLRALIFAKPETSKKDFVNLFMVGSNKTNNRLDDIHRIWRHKTKTSQLD